MAERGEIGYHGARLPAAPARDEREGHRGKELARRPVRHNDTQFMHDGEQVIGRIDYIEPPDLEERSVTRTV